MDVATLGIRVESNGVVVANDRLKGFQGEAAKSEASANRLSASVRRLGASLVAGFAAGFSIRAIVSTLSDFEQSMSAVAAVMRPTAVELESVRDKVKELGATTEFAASQVADGFKFMGLAGWDAAQSIEAMPAVLDLATAASMNLARAADISSNIMSAFGLQASEAATVADTLAVANANANTSVEQLGDGMKYAGPVAQAFGISVGDTAAAIGTLSDAGIQGSMAGTSLRRVMSSLANATPAATRALAGMGLTLEELNPATNDLVDIVDRLAEAGLSAEAAFTIFGDRGAPAILALVENNAKLRELTELLGDAGGAASEMARIMRDNLWGDIKDLQAAVESIIIALGESGLTNVLRLTIKGMTEVFRFLADQMDRLVTYLGVAAVGAAWAFQGAIVTATGAVWRFVTSLGGLRAILMRLGLPALILLAGELVYQFTRLVEKTGGWGEALSLLGEVASGVWDGIKTSATAIPPALNSVWLSIQADFLGMLAAMGDAWNSFVQQMGGVTWRNPFDPSSEEVTLFGLPRIDVAAAERDMDALRNRARELSDEASNLATEGFGKAADALSRLRGEGDMFLGTFEALAGAQTFDSVDEMWKALRGGRGAGDKDDNVLTGLGGGKLNAYQEATKSVLEQIQALNQQALAFGLSETAASRFNTAMDLLRAAQEAKIPITAGLINEINGLADAYAIAEENARILQQQQQLLDQAVSRTATGFADLFEAAITGGKDLLGIVGDIIRDLGRMFLHQGFQALFSGGFGGGGGLLGGFLIPGILHSGGIAGTDGYGHSRALPASVWDNAPRYHNGGIAGLLPNEVPAILERGERVIPANAPANQDVNVSLTVKVDGARGSKEIEEAVTVGVAQGLKTVERNIGNLITDYQMRAG